MISALRQIIYGLVPYDIVLTDDDIRHGRIAEETYGFFEFTFGKNEQNVSNEKHSICACNLKNYLV
jgi:hypothetical protein